MTDVGVWGQRPQRLAIFTTFNENNTFLGIFRLFENLARHYRIRLISA